MAKKIGMLIVASMFASSVYAENNDVYIGVNVSKTDYEYKLDGFSDTLNFDGATGAGLTFGYLKEISDNVDIGFEAVLHNFGSEKANGADSSTAAFIFNIKPTYYFGDSGFSLAASLGLGSYNTDLEVNGVEASESEVSFSYGLEAGYDITERFNINASFMKTSIGYEGLDVDLDAMLIGAKYRF